MVWGSQKEKSPRGEPPLWTVISVFGARGGTIFGPHAETAAGRPSKRKIEHPTSDLPLPTLHDELSSTSFTPSAPAPPHGRPTQAQTRRAFRREIGFPLVVFRTIRLHSSVSQYQHITRLCGPAAHCGRHRYRDLLAICVAGLDPTIRRAEGEAETAGIASSSSLVFQKVFAAPNSLPSMRLSFD